MEMFQYKYLYVVAIKKKKKYLITFRLGFPCLETLNPVKQRVCI